MKSLKLRSEFMRRYIVVAVIWCCLRTYGFYEICWRAVRLVPKGVSAEMTVELIEAESFEASSDEFKKWCYNELEGCDKFKRLGYRKLCETFPRNTDSGSIFSDNRRWKWSRYTVPIVNGGFHKVFLCKASVVTMAGSVEKRRNEGCWHVKIKIERYSYFIEGLMCVMREVSSAETTCPLELNEYFIFGTVCREREATTKSFGTTDKRGPHEEKKSICVSLFVWNKPGNRS